MEVKPTKASRPLALGIGAILILGILVYSFFFFDYHRSISFTDVTDERTKLIDGIESYWSVSDLENFLKGKSLALTIEHGPPPAANDSRPPFIVDTATIQNYSDHGFQGTLIVSFFNNRLMETRFFPKQIDAYLERLAKTENLDLVGKPEITVQKHTRVWVAELAQEKKKYIGWGDVRLNEEMEIWIKRYS